MKWHQKKSALINNYTIASANYVKSLKQSVKWIFYFFSPLILLSPRHTMIFVFPCHADFDFDLVDAGHFHIFPTKQTWARQSSPSTTDNHSREWKALIWLNFHSFYFQLFFPLFFSGWFSCIFAAMLLCVYVSPIPALSNSLQHDVAHPTPSISHSTVRRYRRCLKSQHTTGSPSQAVNSSSRTKDERSLTLMETTCDIISLKVEQTRACKSNGICLNFNFISHWIKWGGIVE